MAEYDSDFAGYIDGATGERIPVEQIQSALDDAAEKYIRPAGAMLPGTAAISLADDVKLGELSVGGEPVGLWPGATLKGGARSVYHVLQASTDGAEEMNERGRDGTPVLLALSLSDDTIARLEFDANKAVDEGRAETFTTDDGREVTYIAGPAGDFKFTVNLKPFEALNGKALTINDVAIWAAVQDAKAAGHDALSRALLVGAYGRYVQQKQRDLPKQDAGKPTTHVQGISKVSEKITEVIADGEPFYIDMSGKKEPKQSVVTSIALSYDAEGVSISKPMSRYDREVHNAAATLWASGRRTVSIRQVYNAMTGAAGSPSPKTAKRIEESLDKQRRTFVTIDFSAELRGRTGELDGEKFTADQCKRESYMLNADKTQILTTDGREITGYTITQEPVLYWHDRRTRQLISYPQKLLEAASAVANNTDTNMLMRSYLIQRVKTMSRKGSKLPKRIRYDTIYREAGAESPTSTERTRMNKTIRAILNVLKDNGEIAGWEEYRDTGSSHRIIGVKIKTKRL